MCFPSGSGTNRIAKQQRADEIARQARIAAGMDRINQTFAGFDDNFFGDRAKAYTEFAMPQVDRAYRRTKDNLIFALARSGLLQSSAGNDTNADLSTEFDQNRVNVANRALDTASQARRDVENVRSGLVSQLNATGDDQAASAAAVRNAQALNQPQGFSPLQEMFTGIAATIAQIGSNANNNYSGFLGRGPRFSTAGGAGSSRVVG